MATSLIFVFIIIICVIFYFSSKEKKRQEKEDLKTSLITEANAYMDEVKKNKALPIVASNLMLEEKEKVLLEEASNLYEPRSVRNNQGSGARIRIVKGLSVGGWSGQSESHMEWRNLDTGTLSLTSQRLIFRGSKENRIIKLTKIISWQVTLDTVVITIDGKAKSISFPVRNPYIWASTFIVMKSANDPEHLGDLKINVELK